MFSTQHTALWLKCLLNSILPGGSVIPILAGGFIIPILAGGSIIPILAGVSIIPILAGGSIIPIRTGVSIIPILAGTWGLIIPFLIILILAQSLTTDRQLRLKPALVQDIHYMIEKTYHIAPLFGRFLGLVNASVTHIWFKRCFHIRGGNLPSGQKTISFGQKHPKIIYVWENLPFSMRFRPFWGLFDTSVTHIGFKRGSHIPK